MAHLTSSVEYGVHCLLWLVYTDQNPASSRDLADFQGISPSLVAKIFPKLQKAGIVIASEGVRGGYQLAKPAENITVLAIVDAIEGHKPLFNCQQIRGRCAIFEGDPPRWATNGVCAIHAVMLHAETSMRDALAEQTLASLAGTVARKAPDDFGSAVQAWLNNRSEARRT